jgi:hypothetical protein
VDTAASGCEEEGLVISMRILFSKAALAALGLPIVLLACTPKLRLDPIGAGGTGGAAAVGATTTSGATTGGGGSGGSIPMGTCTKAGQPFTIMGDVELDGATKLDDKIYLVPDASKRAMVHVVIEDKGQNRVLVRSVIDDPSPLGNFAQHGAVGVPSFRPAAARVVAGQLAIRGINSLEVAQMTFALDPDNGVGPDGLVQALPTPSACTVGGHPGRVVFAPGIDQPRYVVTCVDDPPGMLARLYVSNDSNTTDEIGGKDPASPAMQPALYAYENGIHLVIYGGDKGGSFFSFNADDTQLLDLQPLKLTPGAAELEGVFAAVPLPADDGVTLITAFFDTTAGKGKFLAGPVLSKDYGTLAKIPAGNLAPIEAISTFADVAPIFRPTWDATGIFGGGASTDSASARFYWFTRDGKPLVFGQAIYTSPGPAILAGNAAPLGDINKLVVWIERDSAFTPPKDTVKGQKLVCQIKS